MTLRQGHFINDGEAVVLGPHGVSDFAGLHRHHEQALLHALDMLAGDGEDHRRLTLSLRKANLDCFAQRAVWASKASSRGIAAEPIAAAMQALCQCIS